ncbi:MAG: hypothetical protein HYR56_25120 [Acidobacteria bacterium]|nr:hypothetical protein [Acidobacteriota bacterium]MBI3421834.1 hypothetical protein [Acidobacteriota bacterium]
MQSSMKALVFLIGLVLLTGQAAKPTAESYGLPAGAHLLETAPLKSDKHADRALLLWMLNPTDNPREAGDDVYTCPDETRGHYYSGPTRISLVNTRTLKLINTLELKQQYLFDEDGFDLPYKIHKGSYYRVPQAREGEEGKPVIMSLKDYNGDGRALEFALFDALNCMELQTTLIGYSERQDKVLQYPVALFVEEPGERSTENSPWVDHLFQQKPVTAGVWKYELDYRGRGGTLNQYEIRYDRVEEKFKGKVVVRPE